MIRKIFYNRVFKKAKILGCDLDGDLMFYRGKLYYVDILRNVVKEAEVSQSYIESEEKYDDLYRLIRRKRMTAEYVTAMRKAREIKIMKGMIK